MWASKQRLACYTYFISQTASFFLVWRVTVLDQALYNIWRLIRRWIIINDACRWGTGAATVPSNHTHISWCVKTPQRWQLHQQRNLRTLNHNYRHSRLGCLVRRLSVTSHGKYPTVITMNAPLHHGRMRVPYFSSSWFWWHCEHGPCGASSFSCAHDQNSSSLQSSGSPLLCDPSSTPHATNPNTMYVTP